MSIFTSWTLRKGLGDPQRSLDYTSRISSLEVTWLQRLMANLIEYLLTFLKSDENIVSGNILVFSGILGVFILVKFRLSSILVENWHTSPIDEKISAEKQVKKQVTCHCVVLTGSRLGILLLWLTYALYHYNLIGSSYINAFPVCGKIFYKLSGSF